MAKKQKSFSAALERLEQNPAAAFMSVPAPATDQVEDGGPAPAAKKSEAVKASEPVEVSDPDLKTYTLAELESILGMSHRGLLEYVRSGRLKAVKIGAKWRVSHRTLVAFINGE